jgi:hypothetical protein
MPAPAIKITEAVRATRLRRPFKPAVVKDVDIKGFALVVTTRRAFWWLFFQPRGRNPRTGRRYGGGTRLEIADAHEMSVKDARSKALAAKSAIKEGKDPHRDRMDRRTNIEAGARSFPRL